MSNDNAGGLLGNPLPIVLLALLAAGVLIKHEELKSARPNDSERVKFVPAGQQDVEARLWQDPFAAVEKYEERFKPTTYTGKQLAERIEKIGEAGGRVKVIGVSVFGGSYSEAAESRHARVSQCCLHSVFMAIAQPTQKRSATFEPSCRVTTSMSHGQIPVVQL
jgi:hypothetical protein